MRTMVSCSRSAVRILRANVALTCGITIIMTLTIGLNTAMFTLLNSIVLRPLPFVDSERICVIGARSGDANITPLSSLEYERIATCSESLDSVASLNTGFANIKGGKEPFVVQRSIVSSNFWLTIGAKAYIGRTVVPGDPEDMKYSSAIIGYQLWREQFSSRRDILNSTIDIDGTPYTIIGVLPRSANYPVETQVWTIARVVPSQKVMASGVIGRVKRGFDLEKVQVELRLLSDQLRSKKDAGHDDRILIATSIVDAVDGGARSSLLLMMGAGAVMLVIGCANIAGLILSKGIVRRQEMAIRFALGASRLAIVRQLLIEGVILAVPGAALGVLVAYLCLPFVISIIPFGWPRLGEVGIDWIVLVVSLVISLVASILFSIAPILQCIKSSTNALLKEESHGATGAWRGRANRNVAVAQCALVLMLVISAGLIIRSVHNLQSVNTGFRNMKGIVMTIVPRGFRDVDQLKELSGRILAEVSGLSRVRSAGLTNWLPFGHALVQGSYGVQGGMEHYEQQIAGRVAVSSDYFKAMGIDLLNGRYFNGQDRENSAPVAIVSNSIAKKAWPGQNPIGRRITYRPIPEERDWMEVVGVVSDIRQRSLVSPLALTIYQPYMQIGQSRYLSHMEFIIDTDESMAVMGPLLKQRVYNVANNQPVFAMGSMNDLVGRTIAEQRFLARLLGGFSCLGLIIAGIGLHGTVLLSIQQRRQELAIRVALGAGAQCIARSIAKDAMVVVCGGMVLGVCGAIAFTQLLRSYLFGLGPLDAETFFEACLILSLVGSSAALLPIRHAIQVNPIDELRRV